MAQAIIINSDKTMSEQDVEYADMREIVEGLIEPIDLTFGGEAATLWVNEEFLFTFGPERVNWTATDIASLGGRPEFMLHGPLLGNAFITGGVDENGDTMDVGPKARRAVARVAREAGAVKI